MAKLKKRFVTYFSSLFCLMLLAVPAAAQQNKHRIAYIEAGEYWTYTKSYDAIKAYLDEEGWQGKVTYPIELYFSPGWNKQEELQENANQLMETENIDLIVSAGTAATRAILRNNNGKTPILAISVADAVKSKLVLNQSDSGVDNFSVRIVPGRYEQMFEIFHQVVGFKKLGLIYPNTEDGRKYSSVEDAHLVANDLGFDIVSYEQIGDKESTEDCNAGITYLLEQEVDAFFIPALNCFDWKVSDVGFLLERLTKHNIPSFSREGAITVKAGALMGFSSFDFEGRKLFLGNMAAKILQGEQPRKINMIDDAAPKITFNLEVAARVGLDPSVDILAATDEIYQEIILPDNRLVK